MVFITCMFTLIIFSDYLLSFISLLLSLFLSSCLPPILFPFFLIFPVSSTHFFLFLPPPFFLSIFLLCFKHCPLLPKWSWTNNGFELKTWEKNVGTRVRLKLGGCSLFGKYQETDLNSFVKNLFFSDMTYMQ